MSFMSHTIAFALGAFAARTFANSSHDNAVRAPFSTAGDEMDVGDGFDTSRLDDSVLGEEDPGAADGSVDAAQMAHAGTNGSASSGAKPSVSAPGALHGGV